MSTSTGIGDPPGSPSDDAAAAATTPTTPHAPVNSAAVRDPAGPAGTRRSARSWRPLILRLHFYAGLLVGPFLLIAALTGALYALAPSIEKFVYADLLTVEPADGTALPLAQQVAAAQAAHPDLTVAAVLPAADPTSSTRVHFADPGLGAEELRAVFVDPYTGTVLGSETSWFGSLPFSTWVDVLHRDLHLGETGNLYSELAASWLWLVALGGLLLWWNKFRRDRVRGRRARLVRVDRSVPGRARTLNWHGATGVWILVMLLFLSATGLTWSPYAGENVTELREAMSWQRPQLDTALTGPASAGGEHGGHGGAPAAGASSPAGIDLDRVVAAANSAGVQAPVEITLPAEPGQAIGVAESAKAYRLTTDAAAVDPATLSVTSVLDYDSAYPFAAKLADWGIRMHMGTLFGLLNQLLLVAVALALITVIVRGYRLWWQRRPTRGTRWAAGRPPPRGAVRRAPLPGVLALAAAAIAIGWFLPLFGIPLLGFLLIDVIIAGIGRRSGRAPAGT
ncbi:PepSY-associated TM helix domain-containing protein [Nocardia sp. NPDC055321]